MEDNGWLEPTVIAGIIDLGNPRTDYFFPFLLLPFHEIL